MTPTELHRAFLCHDSSERLEAAMAAGTQPDVGYIEVLVTRCAVEPDFYVRDMLTWALLQQDRDVTVERVMHEVSSLLPQARSQALHTLSKLREPQAWPVITKELLENEHDEIARTAWRAAVALVPDAEQVSLAEILATQFGRGSEQVLEIMASLTRAFVELGHSVLSVVERAQLVGSDIARVHAIATERIIRDPDEGFEAAMYEARKQVDDVR